MGNGPLDGGTGGGVASKDVASAAVDPAATTTGELLERAREGRSSAVERIFRRLLPSVERWARGRLPAWARRRLDTADLVQEAFFHLFRRMPRIEPRREHALRAYLLTAIQNRIRDEVRRAGHGEVRAAGSSVAAVPQGSADSPLARAIAGENEERFRAALARLGADDRMLVVARIDLGYSYEQVALALGRRSPEAARVAVRRALLRLARELGAPGV